MICPNCGCECDDNAMFCRKCGTKINSFHSDITQTSIDKIDNTEEDIFAGIKIESGREGYSENENKKSSYKIQKLDDEVEEDLEEFDDSYISHSKQHNYKSASHDYSSSNKVKKNTTKKNISKKKAPKKKMSKKKVLGLIFLIIVLMAATSVGTLAVKKSIMTGKFDKYYNIGEKYYKEENYEYAKSQYILASSNAFTKEQKIKAYEKVCQVDEILGKYDEEEMKYLEYLIDVDNQNIDYYKKLIVLYQNNDMDSNIKTLVNSAPANLRKELENFDGTVPSASVKAGTYDKPIEVKLSASDDVKIYYTTDGSDPSDSVSRKKYSGTISFATEGTYTLRAYSVDKNKKKSKEAAYKYILEFKKINEPTVDLKSGEYSTQEKITVTADSGCSVYFTTDGTTPTKKSQLYTEPIKIPKKNSIYCFVAIDDQGITSSVVTRAYNYVPKRISYSQASNSLTDYLVSNGKFENNYGEFENGDVGYLEYKKITEISSEEYYIINCEIEDKDGKSVSSQSYAVSCESGTVYGVKYNGGSYSLD